MDPNAVVLEISSDEEGGWDYSTDGRDNHNWIADLLDEVNKDDCGYDNDSDEVVVVDEVIPLRKPRKKLTSKPCNLIGFDDDCVILDHDPDKNLEVRNDDPVNRDDDDDDDDDLVVVSEKGQVACRDYPHSRHLCIKFPFSSTPNQSHCDQCYCYVCDSLAPCVYWGNGSGSIDHCLATDKDSFWKLERQNLKNGSKSVGVPPTNLVPPGSVLAQTPSISSSFGVSNIVNQNRIPFLSSMNKYKSGLVSQHLTRTSSCMGQIDRVNHSYNLGTPFHRPVFKRTVSAGVAPTTNRYSYSRYRNNYRNRYSGSLQPPNLTFEEPLPRSKTPFDFSPNFQPQVSSDSYVETPVVLQPQGQSSLLSYSIPSEASLQESQGQKSTIDPEFFHDVSWPQSQTNNQPAAQSSPLEGAGPTSEPSLARGSEGLVDYEYDNWLFNNQPCEPDPMDAPGSFGLNEFSSEPAFIDTGTIFDF